MKRFDLHFTVFDSLRFQSKRKQNLSVGHNKISCTKRFGMFPILRILYVIIKNNRFLQTALAMTAWRNNINYSVINIPSAFTRWQREAIEEYLIITIPSLQRAKSNKASSSRSSFEDQTSTRMNFITLISLLLVMLEAMVKSDIFLFYWYFCLQKKKQKQKMK